MIVSSLNVGAVPAPAQPASDTGDAVQSDFAHLLEDKIVGSRAARHAAKKAESTENGNAAALPLALLPQPIPQAGDSAALTAAQDEVLSVNGARVTTSDERVTGTTALTAAPDLMAGIISPRPRTNLPQAGLSVDAAARPTGTQAVVHRTEQSLNDSPSPGISAQPLNAALTLPLSSDGSREQEMLTNAAEGQSGILKTSLTAPAVVDHTLREPAVQAAFSVSETRAAVPPPVTVLDQKLGTPAWQQSLGQQLTLFTREGTHHAQLRLHPDDLGEIQVNLRLNNSDAQLHFVTGNHQVKAALEAAMPHLRTMLEESGINLGQSSVGADASAWGSSPDENEKSAGERQPEQDATVNAEVSASSVRHINLNAGINTFV